MPPRTERVTKLAVILAVGLAIALGALGQHEFVDKRSETGLILWGAAIACFLPGLWLAGKSLRVLANPALETPAEPPIRPATEMALFAAIMALGVFFRLYRIESIPQGLNNDAAENGLYAITITQGIGYTPYMSVGWGQETMFHYIIAFFQVLMGPTKLALDLAAITIGVATLPALYLLTRRLFDTRVALVSTFLVAASGWHITFSRVGWRAILVPLFYALIFYFLARALQERKARDFVLAGVFLGVGLDTYNAARVLPLIVLAYLLYEAVRRPQFIRKEYAKMALFGISAIVAFAPLGWYALHHWDEFTRRSQSTWIGSRIEDGGSIQPLFINIKDTLLAFNFRAHGSDFFTRAPLLDAPISVLFPFGLVYSLARWRERGHFWLLAMFVLTLVVGIASSPNGQRLIGAVVPVTAFAAVFAIAAWRWLSRAYPDYRVIFSIAVLALLAYTAYSTYDGYLGPNRKAQFGFDPGASAVGRYMDSRTSEYRFHVAGPSWSRDPMTYLSYRGTGDPFLPAYSFMPDPQELLLIAPATDKGTGFIIGPAEHSTEVRDALAARFPSAVRDEIEYGRGSLRGTAYMLLVPAGGGQGADLSAYTSPDVLLRDAERASDLQRIAAALLQYRDRAGGFPDTSNSAGVACVYGQLGPLCVLQDQLDAEVFADPRGGQLRYGYWYRSDGRSFAVYASFEGIIPPDNSCDAADATLTDTPNLYCITH